MWNFNPEGARTLTQYEDHTKKSLLCEKFNKKIISIKQMTKTGCTVTFTM